MAIENWREALSEDVVRNYADGTVSWREIRDAGTLDDFNIMLNALKELELRLPRARANRDAPGKKILADLLSANRIAA